MEYAIKYKPRFLAKVKTQQSLVDALLDGQRQAQKLTYERFGPRMFAIPLRYGNSKEEASAILNEAFFKVFTTIKNFRQDGSLEAWVYKIVFNTTMDHVRKNLKHKKYQSIDTCPDYSIVRNEALDNLKLEELYEQIHKLPANERSVFSLYAIDGYKHREIAQLLDIPLGTSKWYLNNARKLLVEYLKSIGYER